MNIKIELRYSIVDEEECERLHKEGMSHRKLAEHFKVSLRQIQNTLDMKNRRRQDKEQGIKRRLKRYKAT